MGVMERPYKNINDETVEKALEWSLIRLESATDRYEQVILADIGSIVVEQLIRMEGSDE